MLLLLLLAAPKFGISPFPTRTGNLFSLVAMAMLQQSCCGFLWLPTWKLWERRLWWAGHKSLQSLCVLLGAQEWPNRNTWNGEIGTFCQTPKTMELIHIHFLPLIFSPPRQGLQCSCCCAQLGHTEISTWERSAFIAAKLLLNLEQLYSHYSCDINCQSDLLSAHPKQHILSFQARRGFGSHHSQEVSCRTTGFNSSIQADKGTKSHHLQCFVLGKQDRTGQDWIPGLSVHPHTFPPLFTYYLPFRL